MVSAFDYIAANSGTMVLVLAFTLFAAAFGAVKIREQQVRASFFQHATVEMESAMISAERVLQNGATPPAVREVLLTMLNAVSDPELGRSFSEFYLKTTARKSRKPAQPNELSRAIDRLHLSHPELAADIHKALMAFTLFLPVMYADQVDILENAGEGAMAPESVFDRVAKVGAMLKSEKNGKNGGDGTALAY